MGVVQGHAVILGGLNPSTVVSFKEGATVVKDEQVAPGLHEFPKNIPFAGWALCKLRPFRLVLDKADGDWHPWITEPLHHYDNLVGSRLDISMYPTVARARISVVQTAYLPVFHRRLI